MPRRFGYGHAPMIDGMLSVVWELNGGGSWGRKGPRNRLQGSLMSLAKYQLKKGERVQFCVTLPQRSLCFLKPMIHIASSMRISALLLTLKRESSFLLH